MGKQPFLVTVILCLSGVTMMNFQCDKYDVLPPLKYEFSEKLALYPLKKAYKINDTIWIEFQKTNKQLFDTKSNQGVFLDSGVVAFGVNITPIYNTPVHPVDGYGDFVVLDAAKVDSFNHDVFGVYVQKVCSEPNFHFKIGYVPKYKGYYAMPVGGNSVSSCDSASNDRLFASITYTFDISDSNRDVYLQIPAAERKKYASTWLDYGAGSSSVYVFKVE
jgi:hypothetical protein